MNNAGAKLGCKYVLEAQRDRVVYFANRMSQRIDTSPDDTVIVLINVDDIHGNSVADLLMPNHDWQQYRDNGDIPFARGLAGRDGMFDVVKAIDEDAAQKMNTINTAVVVIDCGTVEVFEYELI